jgi:ligand-binding SRPBCC domain-containing protein
MVSGRFARFEHDHFFEPSADGTIMRDVIAFDAPFGAIGRAFSALFLTGYIRRLIEERNRHIRGEAEASNGGRPSEHGDVETPR